VTQFKNKNVFSSRVPEENRSGHYRIAEVEEFLTLLQLKDTAAFVVELFSCILFIVWFICL